MPHLSEVEEGFRFSFFELDLRAEELRKNGLRIKLQAQPFQILVRLLSQPGAVVTREQLRKQLWPSDTFVDFDNSLNTAIAKLRDALGDTAESPRFIETIPRRGYRFIYPAEALRPESGSAGKVAARKLSTLKYVVSGALAALILIVGWTVLKQRIFRSSAEMTNANGIRSIAILPLANLSGDPGQEYFADGMTEALITELGKVQALRVISHQSVMHCKGTNKTVPQIARELTVDAVVEGSALHVGGKVRITAQLIQAAPERHLWSQSYERDLSDVISLQREIAQTIVREIQLTLTPAEQMHLAKANPVSPEAYEAYLKGRYHLDRFSVEDTRKAREWFQRAINTDPQYAPGYAGLASAYTRPYGGWAGSVAEEYETARSLTHKAITLDATLAEAHAVLADIKGDYDWDWAGTEEEVKRAISLNPNSAQAHTSYAGLLSMLARHKEALREAQTALQLDPVSLPANVNLGYTFYWARQYDQAIEQLQKTLALDPNYSHSYIGLGRAYLEKGMGQKAVEALQKGDSLYYAGRRPSNLLGYAYGTLGQTAKALRVVHQLEILQRQGDPDAACDLALVYVGLGDKDQAMRLLEAAYRQRYPDMIMLKVDPQFDRLRSDSRFQNLLQKMNFPTQ